jgi:hypothetical protein
MAPMLIHFVASLPPEGVAPAWERPGAGTAPTLIHFAASLPSEGVAPACGRTGAGAVPASHIGPSP